MRFTALILILLACLMLNSPFSPLYGQEEAEGTRFIEGLDSIPIVADLALMEDPVVFDSPKGTIASLILSGSKPGADYLRLYHDSLTAFGWVCGAVIKNRLICTNSTEKLSISMISKASGPARLQVKLQPKS